MIMSFTRDGYQKSRRRTLDKTMEYWYTQCILRASLVPKRQASALPARGRVLERGVSPQGSSGIRVGVPSNTKPPALADGIKSAAFQMARPRSYDYRKKTEEILIRLKAQHIPFLAHAAEYCGVHRKTARQWMTRGAEDTCEDPDLVQFAIEVRRIQADWIDRKSASFFEVDSKERNMQASQIAFVLQRLDRENFDPPKEVKNVVRDVPLPGEEPTPPPATTKAEIENAADELGKTVN